jgi:dTMP kinase
VRTRGRLIVFEGGEGCGKSTQAARLAAVLDADLTREPGGTPVGERIRTILLDRDLGHLDPRAELLLMAAARAQHVAKRIRPALEHGRDVVCDRFSGSTFAYQGFGRGLPLEDVAVACELAVDGLRVDLTILLDVPIEVSTARRCGSPDRIEAEDDAFHRRLHEGFRTLAAADPDHWVEVDGDAEPDEVADRVRRAVEARLGPAGQGSAVADASLC